MAKLLKLRRGTTTQHGSFTGAEGEVTVDTDKETLVVHDGSTAGGHPVAAEDMANVSSASIAGRLANDSIATSKIAGGTLPSDVKVNSANIVDSSIVNSDVNASAAIAGTKISPDFGSQNIVTTGHIDLADASTIKLGDSDEFQIQHTAGGASLISETGSGNLDISATNIQLKDASGNNKIQTNGAGVAITGNITATGNANIDGDLTLGGNRPRLNFYDSDNNPDLAFINDSGMFQVFDQTNGVNRIQINSNGHVDVLNHLDVNNGLDVTGDITVTGTVDGRDVAADGTKLDAITTGNAGEIPGTASLANGVTAVTQSAGDSTTKVATTAFVSTEVANLVDSSPAALNTLNELAAAINDDASFSTTVNNNIATKMPLSGGEFTGNITVENITPDGDSSRNIGTSSVRFANGYFDTLYGDGSNLTGIVSFVSGMIIMYNSATPPSGWYLCNGQNGTPDLRDRFIVGAGNSYSHGATGGNNTATDTVSISGSDTVNISISGSGTTGNPNQGGIQYGRPGYSDCARSSHTHNFSFSGSGSDTVSISGSDTVSIDTRSPYYALTFIMKA